MSNSDDEKLIKSFTVHVPIELVKSEGTEEDDEAIDSWKIKGIASTNDQDLQGEEVLQDGLDISVLKAGRGIFNHDHRPDPENVLGQIEDAEFVEYNGKKSLMVKGYLFKQQPRAQAYYNILRSIKKGSAPRVHFSIEGKIVERDMVNTRKIRKAKVSKVALTLDPVNPHTFAELAKSLHAQNKELEQDAFFNEIMQALKDSLDKAISAGAGYADAPSSRSGGAAMSKESLDCKVKNISYTKKKKLKKSLLEAIFSNFEKLLGKN